MQLVSNATRTGTAVRLSKSTDLIWATPATPTITGLIGLRNKPRLAPFCITNMVVLGSRLRLDTILGTNGTNVNNGATLLPVTILKPNIPPPRTEVSPIELRDNVCSAPTNESIRPRLTKPCAKICPPIIRVTA